MRRRGRDLARGEGGSAIVEFVLVIPVLLLVLFVGLDFSRVLLAHSTIGNASREGARYAVLHPGATSDEVEQFVRGFAGPLSREALSVVVEYSNDNRASFAPTLPAAQRRPQPVTVKVSVRYPWDATSAVAAGFFAASTGSATVVSSALMDMQR